jgi:hypothetical protein
VRHTFGGACILARISSGSVSATLSTALSACRCDAKHGMYWKILAVPPAASIPALTDSATASASSNNCAGHNRDTINHSWLCDHTCLWCLSEM